MGDLMGTTPENCLHLGGLRATIGTEFLCPSCGSRLDHDGVERWVREAEMARDESYAGVEVDQFSEIVREEWQREVYRRRKVLYELRNVPRGMVPRPEMILVSYDAAGDAYDCRIFYKEPRPAGGLERIRMGADLDAILELRSHPDPNARLASGKVEEFHALRQGGLREDEPPLLRRVFYANEL